MYSPSACTLRVGIYFSNFDFLFFLFGSSTVAFFAFLAFLLFGSSAVAFFAFFAFLPSYGCFFAFFAFCYRTVCIAKKPLSAEGECLFVDPREMLSVVLPYEPLECVDNS